MIQAKPVSRASEPMYGIAGFSESSLSSPSSSRHQPDPKTDQEQLVDSPSSISLTLREIQVGSLLHLANKEIAYRLDISLSTVKMHVANLMQALGAESRTEAAVILVRQQLTSREQAA